MKTNPDKVGLIHATRDGRRICVSVPFVDIEHLSVPAGVSEGGEILRFDMLPEMAAALRLELSEALKEGQ